MAFNSVAMCPAQVMSTAMAMTIFWSDAPAAYKGDVSPWPTDLSAGKVYAWFGSESGLGDPGTAANADWIFNEILGQSQQGVYLDAAGDVDGDGFDDILVGSPYYGYNEESRAVAIYSTAPPAACLPMRARVGMGPKATPGLGQSQALETSTGMVSRISLSEHIIYTESAYILGTHRHQHPPRSQT